MINDEANAAFKGFEVKSYKIYEEEFGNPDAETTRFKGAITTYN